MGTPETPGSGNIVRPSAGGALMIVLGSAAVWVPFVFFFVGLPVTDGSYWSVAFLLAGYLCAWLRARSLSVSREKDTVIIQNFYSTRQVAVEHTTVVRPFHHWADGKIGFMAIHTPGQAPRHMHATVLPQIGERAERAPNVVADALALPLEPRAIGTFRQLLRRW